MICQIWHHVGGSEGAPYDQADGDVCVGAVDCAEQGNCFVVTYTDDDGVVQARRCREATCIEPKLKDADSLKLIRDITTKSGG